MQMEKDPVQDSHGQPATIPFEVTVKGTPWEPEQFEMYKLTGDPDDPEVPADPMELKNLYSTTNPLPQQDVLAHLLEEQRTQKRLSPISGKVPGQGTPRG